MRELRAIAPTPAPTRPRRRRARPSVRRGAQACEEELGSAALGAALDEELARTVDAAAAAGIALDRAPLRFADSGGGGGLRVVRRASGKVRESYELSDGRMVLVTTDRQSAFDRVLASVPFKGQVLNETSAFWMRLSGDVMANALLAVPDPNVCVMRACAPLPIEMVVRAYLTGSTSTSIWTAYSGGAREYCGHALPGGLRKNDPLPSGPIVTPSTKSDERDVPVSGAELVRAGAVTAERWREAEEKCLALFRLGSAEAARRGLILVDTKYELGVDPDSGELLLIDECHTPDSSRYWIAGSYGERHARGAEPESVDKEFFRLWFKERCDPYAEDLPAAPAALVAELSKRYLLLAQTITGERPRLPYELRADGDGGVAARAGGADAWAPWDEGVHGARARIASNLSAYFGVEVTVGDGE